MIKTPQRGQNLDLDVGLHIPTSNRTGREQDRFGPPCPRPCAIQDFADHPYVAAWEGQRPFASTDFVDLDGHSIDTT